MKSYTIALFGEAERGEFRVPSVCQSVEQLMDRFGNPPLHSRGIDCAVQALLYHRKLLFFRVREEGYSYEDYLLGLRLLERQTLVSDIEALCLPGVGDAEIIGAIVPICELYHSLLITSEADLYDYLTEISTG